MIWNLVQIYLVSKLIIPTWLLWTKTVLWDALRQNIWKQSYPGRFRTQGCCRYFVRLCKQPCQKDTSSPIFRLHERQSSWMYEILWGGRGEGHGPGLSYVCWDSGNRNHSFFQKRSEDCDVHYYSITWARFWKAKFQVFWPLNLCLSIRLDLSTTADVSQTSSKPL